MAPKSAKRPAEAKVAPPKKARSAPMADAVVTSIGSADFLSESCRAMLTASVPHSLTLPVEERHECQEMFVRMIGAAMNEMQSKLQEAADTEKAQVSVVEDSKKALDSTIETAQTKLTDATRVTAQKKELFEAATKAKVDAEAMLAHKKQEQMTGDASLVEIRKRKDALQVGVDESLKVIMTSATEAELGQAYAALQPLLADLQVDDSLTTVLPTACGKTRADRGPFDNMAIEALDTCIKDKIAELERILENGAEGASVRAAAVTAAQQDFDAKTAEVEQADSAVTVAVEEEKAVVESLKAARKALAAYEPEYKAATKARDEKEEALKNFTEYNMACFEMLRDKTLTKPVVVETPVAAEEDPVAPVGGA